MDLKEFVKTVLVQIDAAVDEAQKVTNRNIKFSKHETARTVEFDIAVSVKETGKSGGEAKIQVLQSLTLGCNKSKVDESSTVSRVRFGVEVSAMTKPEQMQWAEHHSARVVSTKRRSTNLHAEH